MYDRDIQQLLQQVCGAATTHNDLIALCPATPSKRLCITQIRLNDLKQNLLRVKSVGNHAPHVLCETRCRRNN